MRKESMLFLVFVLALTGSVNAKTAPAPVLDTDFPDAFVMPDGGELFAYATNGKHDGKRLNVPLARSADGVTWSAPVEAMPRPPRWASRQTPDIWAPEVTKVGDSYVMYFSARHAVRQRPDGLTLCVGAAVSAAPQGPFVPQQEPLTCGGQLGVIDASPFRDGDDLYLYMKTDGNCCGVPIGILAQKLSPDGLSLAGNPQVVAGMTNDAAWEGMVIEAPQMAVHDGHYYLFYSGNDYDSDRYAVGYADCDTPLGPCRDAPDNPILKSAPGLDGPGHESLFDFQGKTWISFHAWRMSGHTRYRALYVQPLDWTSGKPRVGQ